MVRHPSHTRTLRVELLFLPGLGEVVAAEATDRLVLEKPPSPVPGRTDALTVEMLTPRRSPSVLAKVAKLRTIVAGFMVLDFPVHHPRALLEPHHLHRITNAMGTAAISSANLAAPMRSFRIDAAGAQSPTFKRLAAQLTSASGLVHDPEDGACLLRFRRGPGQRDWQVLVRLSPRPLSARPWRRARFPGALNATVAAAAVALSRPRCDDRVANLMCGSGTLLIERLLAGPAASAVGVDRDPRALSAGAKNLSGAGLAKQVGLVHADIRSEHWANDDQHYDVVFADPPWEDKVRSGDDAANTHALLLRRAAQLGTLDTRLVVITHRVHAMSRCLQADHNQWQVISETRVWTKGHHPRIYVLGLRGRPPSD